MNNSETLSIKRLGLLREYHGNMTTEHTLLHKKFISEVKKMSESNMELKEMVVNSDLPLDDVEETEKETLSENEVSDDENEPQEFSEKKNEPIKSIYRSLVKRTHPDKNSDPYMNGVYIDAKKYYEKDDLLGLLILCENIKHPYDMDIPMDEVNQETERLLDDMEFMNSSYVYKWHRASEEEKMEIVIRYIIQMTRTDMVSLSNNS